MFGYLTTWLYDRVDPTMLRGSMNYHKHERNEKTGSQSVCKWK